MTCIAYRDGILAADQQALFGGLLYSACKLRIHKDWAIGFSGSDVAICAWLAWFDRADWATLPPTRRMKTCM